LSARLQQQFDFFAVDFFQCDGYAELPGETIFDRHKPNKQKI